MIAVTGATGQLGRLVIDALLKKVAADTLVAAVRTPAKASDIAARGVHVREADYNRPETLTAALQGVDKLLLISGSEVGQREAQHRAVIDAAKAAGVKFIAYTSLLHADKSPLSLGAEHRATEALLAASGVPYALLRNGWYTENYTASIALPWRIMRFSVRQNRAVSLLRHVGIMPTRQRKLWCVTARRARCTSWPAMTAIRWRSLRLKSPRRAAKGGLRQSATGRFCRRTEKRRLAGPAGRASGRFRCGCRSGRSVRCVPHTEPTAWSPHHALCRGDPRGADKGITHSRLRCG